MEADIIGYVPSTCGALLSAAGRSPGTKKKERKTNSKSRGRPVSLSLSRAHLAVHLKAGKNQPSSSSSLIRYSFPCLYVLSRELALVGRAPMAGRLPAPRLV